MPTPLSENVETEIVEYLHLEYGQRPHEEDAIKVTDLDYLGRFQIDQMSVYYWHIKGRRSPDYATIEEWDDGTLCTGLTPDAPPSAAFLDKQITWRTAVEAAPPRDTKRFGWLLFLSPFFLWGLVKMVWAFRSSTKKIARRQKAVSALPVPEALRTWVDVSRPIGPSLHLIPADAEAATHLRALADRLQVEPPAELLAFYQYCDGTRWEGESYETPILPARGIKFGRDCDPPFSSLIRRSLKSSGDDTEELEVIPMGDLTALLGGGEESDLSVDVADDWLLLQAPNTEPDPKGDGDYYLQRTVAISIKQVANYPAGTVFEFEGGSASATPGLSALLGHWTALAESMHEMYKRSKT